MKDHPSKIETALPQELQEGTAVINTDASLAINTGTGVQAPVNSERYFCVAAQAK